MKVGTKAEANAPPAMRVNKISGRRLAALNASIWALVPKARETKTHLINPATLETTNAAMTVLAARAIWRSAFVGMVVTGEDYSRRSACARERHMAGAGTTARLGRGGWQALVRARSAG